MAENGLYDVVGAFQDIEKMLIQSMKVNMKRHIGEENNEQINWTQWQAEMLKGLQEYRKENATKLPGYFNTINDEIDEAIRQAYATGESEQEIELLKALKNGYKATSNGMRGEFFKINKGKLNSLVDSTLADFKKAEKAILRTTDDAYRKIIFSTQMYYASGATNLWQAVDMASKDFLKQGINCVQYKNGARVNIVSYSEMAMRTTNKRANLMGQASKRMEYGVTTVKVTARDTACPICLQWLGRVYYDDVYGSVGKTDGKYPLLSTAVSGGLFHPNCKDGCSTYYEGISRPSKPLTEEEQEEAIRRYGLEQQQRKCERNIRTYSRLANGAIDPDDAVKYTAQKNAWISQYNKLINDNSDVLRADPARLKLYGIDKIGGKGYNALKKTGNKFNFELSDDLKGAERYLKDVLGVKNTSYKGIDIAVANEMNKSLTNAFNFYPELKGKINFYGSAQERNKLYKKEVRDWYYNYFRKNYPTYPEHWCNTYAEKYANKFVGRVNGKAYAFANSGKVYGAGVDQTLKDICKKYAGICVNNKYGKDATSFEESVAHCVDVRWHPVGCDTIKSIFDHEVGHQLDYALGLSDNAEVKTLWNEFLSLPIQERKDALSEYAYYDNKIAEFIAESYSEYLNNPKPRKYAAKIGKIIERLVKK